ncbi:S1/P1 nuclease [Microbulbifer bruguierae]|uniref:S1/P1 nuclease n=1 Tax=Microbulbifer bruguierae TaxID=3029061 RepID=A0ABY8NEC0_9GAMM|nr:S1/P1 nuclease [Microbulbifer bruguierae]WGL17143.1 S1/P1 nuclease [Microbulbifer bruguierae]
MKSCTVIGRFVFSAFLLIYASKIYAWGDDGHRVIGEIAWQYLDAEVRAEVQVLLESAGEGSLAEASTWPDRIRGIDAYHWAAPLHYINLPREWQGYKPTIDCPPAGCILQAIERFSRELADANRTEMERAEALMFLAHFVGDLHQPMHAGLKADRGGNDIEVSFFGFDTNLHWLWDSKLPAGFITDWHAYASNDDTSPELVAAWQASTPEQWTAESHQLAHANAYTATTRLGEEYYVKNRPVVEQRLRQGGIRLAALLNEALMDH